MAHALACCGGLRSAGRQAESLVIECEFVTSSARPEQFPADGLPEVAFLGRSNVGKSSLLNALVGKRAAFISSTPGRTQTINFYRINGSLYFVDLPGYGYAKVPKDVSRQWGSLVESYLMSRETLDLSFLILDARRGWMDQDLQLKHWLEVHDRRYQVIATKIDKLNQSETQQCLARIRKEDVEPLLFSATTGRGVREIWQVISKTPQRR